jgi:sugar/nucleoside kinase (ribokinase family)
MKDAGLTTSLDTNDDPDDTWKGGLEEALRYVDVFLPNEREAQKAAGVEGVESAIAKLAKMIPLVVVKVGSEGAIAQRGGERFTSRPLKVGCVDAVGAGDSFDAGFLHEYVRGSDLEKCLRAGNLAGALSTTRAGGTEAFRDAEYRNQFIAERSD